MVQYEFVNRRYESLFEPDECDGVLGDAYQALEKYAELPHCVAFFDDEGDFPSRYLKAVAKSIAAKWPGTKTTLYLYALAAALIKAYKCALAATSSIATPTTAVTTAAAAAAAAAAATTTTTTTSAAAVYVTTVDADARTLATTAVAAVAATTTTVATVATIAVATTATAVAATGSATTVTTGPGSRRLHTLATDGRQRLGPLPRLRPAQVLVRPSRRRSASFSGHDLPGPAGAVLDGARRAQLHVQRHALPDDVRLPAAHARGPPTPSRLTLAARACDQGGEVPGPLQAAEEEGRVGRAGGSRCQRLQAREEEEEGALDGEANRMSGTLGACASLARPAPRRGTGLPALGDASPRHPTHATPRPRRDTPSSRAFACHAGTRATSS